MSNPSPNENQAADATVVRPTRQLTQDEYREWVHHAVSGEMWRKFLAALSVFGITTIVGVWTYTSNVTERALDDRIKGQTSALVEKMNARIGDEITYQVRHNKLIENAARQAVQQLTEQKVIDSALGQLIVTQSQNILRAKDASSRSLRELALQQVLLFGDEREKADAINLVLQNPSSTGSVFQLALRHYQVPKVERDQSDVLHNILTQALNSQTEFNEESWNAVRNILNRRAHIRFAAQWIRTNNSSYGGSSNVSLRAIIRHVAETGGLAAAEEFVEWISSGSSDLVMLGLHGLTELRLASETEAERKLRHALVRRAMTSLARVDREREGLSDFLSRLLTAIHQRETRLFPQYAKSSLANPRIRVLLSNLSRGARNASWTFVEREIRTVDDLREYGQYESEGPGALAYQGLASLLDAGPKSNDWQTLIAPALAESKTPWTAAGQGRLLINAWVQRLRANGASPSSIDDAARLFVEAHAKHDSRLLLSANFASYRFLASSASNEVIQSLVERAPRLIGVAERDPVARDFQDENEATILSELLTRALRDQILTEEKLLKLRNDFNELNRLQTSQSIWFAAAARAAGMRDSSARAPNYPGIIIALFDRAVSTEATKDGALSRLNAVALLFVITNRTFLSAPNIQSAAEIANLHLLADEIDDPKVEPQVLRLAKTVASEAKEAFRWVGKLPDLPLRNVDGTPIQLSSGANWLSFDRQADLTTQVDVDPPSELNAIIIDANERVTEPEIVRSVESRLSGLIRIPATSAGKMYLRIGLQSRQGASVALRHEAFYRAAKKVQPPKPGSKVPEIRIGVPVSIQTAGRDDVWFRLNAKNGITYTLRTFRLQSLSSGDSIDTTIEVTNPEDNKTLYSDDDSGEGLASRLAFRSDRDGPYHVLIRNTDTTGGTFSFDVVEKE